MKMTFEIPDIIGERFKAVVPRGSRSPLVAKLIERRLVENNLDEACRKANDLNLDLSDWEKLNESVVKSGDVLSSIPCPNG